MAGDLTRAKSAAALAGAARVHRGATIALGTGSTATMAIRALAERFTDGGDLTCVASSLASEKLARDLGLPVRSLEESDRFDLMLDGADEVTPSLELTKGGGGALFREKFLARLSREVVILVDPSKLVPRVGTRVPIPVEVVPFARPALLRELRGLGLGPALRADNQGQPFLTDNGNEVLDLTPKSMVEDAAGLEALLHGLPGAVECGLFIGLVQRVLVGFPDGSVQERLPPAAHPRPA
ncbi:MAG: ribose-5-phosphate isomerase RpiA [Thermoplasmata archaeon]|nr:ribose-5-phosphate isomerase RpiA [Thermoplasmata archaeon]MCI4340789.1 ribose-5-phosphate isomerase RpiA [Thermoplasmata archaeon]